MLLCLELPEGALSAPPLNQISPLVFPHLTLREMGYVLAPPDGRLPEDKTGSQGFQLFCSYEEVQVCMLTSRLYAQSLLYINPLI